MGAAAALGKLLDDLHQIQNDGQKVCRVEVQRYGQTYHVLGLNGNGSPIIWAEFTEPGATLKELDLFFSVSLAWASGIHEALHGESSAP